jgi:hypothetical protein
LLGFGNTPFLFILHDKGSGYVLSTTVEEKPCILPELMVPVHTELNGTWPLPGPSRIYVCAARPMPGPAAFCFPAGLL